MYKPAVNFSKTKLAVAILLATQSFNAHSYIISLDLTADTSARVDTNAPTTDSDAAINADVQSSSQQGNAFANASATTDGWFYTTASGADGSYESTSQVSQTYSVTNGNIDQFFDFEFEVMNGSINATCGSGYGDSGDYGDYGSDNGYGDAPVNDSFGFFGSSSDPCLDNDFAQASYSAEILFNGTSIWASSAGLTSNENGISSSYADVELGDINTLDSGFYSWSRQSFILDLGEILANEVFTLEYSIEVSTSGLLDDPFSGYNNSYAQFGDPNGFGTQSANNLAPASVPEPTALSLLAAGLFSLGFMRRRKKKI